MTKQMPSPNLATRSHAQSTDTPRPVASPSEKPPTVFEDPALVQRYQQTITPEDLAAHLYVFASDYFEGRETTTRGQKLAAYYLAGQYRKMGLAPKGTAQGAGPYAPEAYLQPFTVYGHRLQEARLTAERVSVRHDHGHDADRPRVAEDLDELLGGPQRDFAVGDLHVALRAEIAAEHAQLVEDGLHRQGRDLVGLAAEVTAGAGEVALRLDADRGSAAGGLLAEALSREFDVGGERRPAFFEERTFLGGDRVFEQLPRAPQ